MSEHELQEVIALRHAQGVGDQNIKQLIAHFGSASAIFKLSKAELLKVHGIGEVTASSIFNKSTFDQAEEIINDADKHDVQIHTYLDQTYPERLKLIDDAPAVLFTKGEPSYNAPRTVAIVGTRNATEYGYEFLDRFIPKLKELNLQVISGLAYGIDIYAHKTCIQEGIPTHAVLANSLETVYPKAHTDIASDLQNNACLISENKIITKPDAPKFPARNRIIAGMVDAVIVIEAAIKGGAVITARVANNYNKDVFALPGSIDRKYSKGCNHLIKSNQASLIEGINDLKYVMNWGEVSSTESQSEPSFDFSQLSPEEQHVVNIFMKINSDLTIDELSIKTQIPINQLAVQLLNLEFKNIVKPLQGNRYKLQK